jgi:type III secretion system YscQ/HrcQ family protein
MWAGLYSELVVRACNELVMLGGQLRLDFASGTVRLRQFLPQARVGNGRVTIYLTRAGLLQQMRSIAWQVMSEPLRARYIESRYAEVCQRLSAWLGQPVTVERVNINSGQSLHDAIACTARSDAASDELLMVHLDAPAMALLRTALTQIPIASAAWNTALPTALRLIAGSQRLSIEQVNRLAVGDLILPALPSSNAEDNKGRLRLRLGRHDLFLGSLRGRSLAIDRVLLTDQKAHPMTQAAGNPIDNVALDVAFQIGEVKVTLAQLRAMAPGYTFETTVALDDPLVTVLVDGHAQGQGKLVGVGSRIGVQITAWAGRDGL